MTRVTRMAVALAGAGLVAACLVAAPATASSEYGRTAAPDRVLRAGCHNYGYRFRVTAPTDDWTLETFLRDPDGENLASGAFLSDADGHLRHSRFRFCRYSTRPGVFRIRALLTWYGDFGEEHRVWLETSRFRLSRPR
jgi:hypothetical protein